MKNEIKKVITDDFKSLCKASSRQRCCSWRLRTRRFKVRIKIIVIIILIVIIIDLAINHSLLLKNFLEGNTRSANTWIAMKNNIKQFWTLSKTPFLERKNKGISNSTMSFGNSFIGGFCCVRTLKIIDKLISNFSAVIRHTLCLIQYH